MDDPTETSFSVAWDPVAGAVSYKIYVREFPKEWDTAEVVAVTDAKQVADARVVVEERFPTSTYQIRVAAVFADGKESEPSEEATIDTAVGNCVPKSEQEKKKCVVM